MNNCRNKIILKLQDETVEYSAFCFHFNLDKNQT
jgi:hypothetical protein